MYKKLIKGTVKIEVIKKALNIKINDEPLFTSFQVTFNVLDQSLLEIKDKIKDKKIIIPDNVFVRGRTLNESYKASKKFITDFKVAMNIIEKKNNL